MSPPHPVLQMTRRVVLTVVLSSLLQVATMIRADWLFLLTDVPCLYTANPSTDPSAEPIHEVRDIASLQVSPSALLPDCFPFRRYC